MQKRSGYRSADIYLHFSNTTDKFKTDETAIR